MKISQNIHPPHFETVIGPGCARGQMVLCALWVERATSVQLKARGDAFRLGTDEFSNVNKVSLSAAEEKVQTKTG